VSVAGPKGEKVVGITAWFTACADLMYAPGKAVRTVIARISAIVDILILIIFSSNGYPVGRHLRLSPCEVCEVASDTPRCTGESNGLFDVFFPSSPKEKDSSRYRNDHCEPNPDRKVGKTRRFDYSEYSLGYFDRRVNIWVS